MQFIVIVIGVSCFLVLGTKCVISIPATLPQVGCEIGALAIVASGIRAGTFDCTPRSRRVVVTLQIATITQVAEPHLVTDWNGIVITFLDIPQLRIIGTVAVGTANQHSIGSSSLTVALVYKLYYRTFGELRHRLLP